MLHFQPWNAHPTPNTSVVATHACPPVKIQPEPDACSIPNHALKDASVQKDLCLPRVAATLRLNAKVTEI